MTNKLYDSVYLEKIHQFLLRTKERSYQLLDPHPADSIADIGCGIGHDVIHIAKSGAKIFGIDHDGNMLIKAKQELPIDLEVDFICCSADNIPLKSSSINKIRFDRVFQHIADYERVLKEAKRLLKTDGYLQIVDIDYLSLSLFLEDPVFERKIIDAIAYRRIPNGHKVRALPIELERQGFKLLLTEIHNYIITDFTFANYIISFNRLIDEELERKNITSLEYDIWQCYKNKPEQFALSLNFMLMSAKKMD